MSHIFNPFPKYNKYGHEGKIFQKIILMLIIIICTGFIFYLNMYKPKDINPIQDIKNIFADSPKKVELVLTPTKPEFVDLSLIESDLSTTEKNLDTIDKLDNL